MFGKAVDRTLAASGPVSPDVSGRARVLTVLHQTLRLSVRLSTVSILARPNTSDDTGPDAASVRSIILPYTAFSNSHRTCPVAEFIAKYRTCPVTIPDASSHSVTSATNSSLTLSSSPLLKCANHQVYHLVHMC